MIESFLEASMQARGTNNYLGHCIAQVEAVLHWAAIKIDLFYSVILSVFIAHVRTHTH